MRTIKGSDTWGSVADVPGVCSAAVAEDAVGAAVVAVEAADVHAEGVPASMDVPSAAEVGASVAGVAGTASAALACAVASLLIRCLLTTRSLYSSRW